MMPKRVSNSLRTSLAVAITFVTTEALAVKISLPTRYVLSTSVVSSHTGVSTSIGESYKVIPSPIEITKRTEDGKTTIQFIALPRTAGLQGIDHSEVSVANLAPERKADLLAVLKSLPERMRKANSSPLDGSETIFETEGMNIDFVTEAKWKKGYTELTIGSKTFVLNDTGDIRKLVKALEEFR
jgi:hypothetical protein